MGALQQAPTVIKYRKPEYRRIIENMLIRYPVYKQLQQTDFPPLFQLMQEHVQGGDKEYQSSTERYGIRRAERARLIDQVDFAMLSLDKAERQLIAATYFSDDREPAYIVREKLGLSRNVYHRRKKIIFEKMADALQLV